MAGPITVMHVDSKSRTIKFRGAMTYAKITAIYDEAYGDPTPIATGRHAVEMIVVTPVGEVPLKFEGEEKDIKLLMDRDTLKMEWEIENSMFQSMKGDIPEDKRKAEKK